MYVCVFHYRHSLCYFSIELPLIYLSIPCTPPPFFKLLLRTSTILPPYCPLPSTYVLEQSRTPSFKGSASDDDMIWLTVYLFEFVSTYLWSRETRTERLTLMSGAISTTIGSLQSQDGGEKIREGKKKQEKRGEKKENEIERKRRESWKGSRGEKKRGEKRRLEKRW